MTARVMRTRHRSLNVSLCDLAQGVGGGQALVDAVALDGVGALWRRVTRGHVGRGGR